MYVYSDIGISYVTEFWILTERDIAFDLTEKNALNLHTEGKNTLKTNVFTVKKTSQPMQSSDVQNLTVILYKTIKTNDKKKF